MFRNSNWEYEGCGMAQTSNQEFSFYAPKNNDDYDGSFRWFDGNYDFGNGEWARNVLMTLSPSGLITSGDVTGFANLSDRRFKENIEDYTNWKGARLPLPSDLEHPHHLGQSSLSCRCR